MQVSFLRLVTTPLIYKDTKDSEIILDSNPGHFWLDIYRLCQLQSVEMPSETSIHEKIIQVRAIQLWLVPVNCSSFWCY